MARKIAPALWPLRLVLEMIRLKLILCIFSVLPILNGVKVNMRGSLRLGKEVMDAISHYMSKTNLIGLRRSYSGDGPDGNAVVLIVNSAFLCRDLNFCKGSVGKLVDEYIIALTNAIESIFEGLVEDKNAKENDPKPIIFEEELRAILIDVKKYLKHANEQDEDKTKSFKWLNLLKRISAKFHNRAVSFATQRLEGSENEINEVKKMLTQKLTIAMTLVELKFEHKLCSTYKICSKSYECTKALDVLLEGIEHLPDKKVREYLRYFYENLAQTSFYSILSESTNNEFQSIINEMAYSDNLPSKNVLSIIHKTVKDRLAFVEENTDNPSGRDVKLVHVILSDLDHFYSKEKDPFRDYLTEFFEWANKDAGRFSSSFHRVMNDIQKQLSFESADLVLKLRNEVKVFLEITVDPEK